MKYEPGDLLEDTRVHRDPVQPHRLRATISPAWNILYAFGGVTMATAVNAARACVSQPGFELLTATATFLSPVKAGTLLMNVRTLRKGKGSEQLTVELHEGEKPEPSLHLITSFGPKRESDTALVDLAAPDVPQPDEIPAHMPRGGSAMLMLPYYHSVETRVVPAVEQPGPANQARWRGWLRFVKTPRLADGSLDPIAYVPACDMIGPALRVARGRGAASQMVISLEISLHFYARTDSEWLLQDAQIYQAADGYASGVVHLWDQHKRLVGHALQRAVLRPRAF